MVLKVAVPEDAVKGGVEEGYGPVAEAFRRNFAERDEVGAACAVYRDGRKVVDLWGGYRDGVTRALWEQDTLVPLFSTTKGVASMAIAVAHSRGLLAYDAPVAHYWPEFAENGKERVTVRQLLSHQAGLCAIDEPLGLPDLVDLDRIAAAVARQPPAWEPGTRHGYHGWYEGELIRRVDPQSRTLGRFFADEVAAPLGLEFFVGLPDRVPHERVARIHGYTARGDAAPSPRVPGFSLGYVKPFPRFRFGSGADLAFGTPGAGGSFGFADPGVGVGFAYLMNRTGFRLYDDPRELALRDALYRCLGERPQHG